MKLGLADEANLTDESLAAVREPFADDDPARRSPTPASASGRGLRRDRAPAAVAEVPVRVIYGERDRILPDVAETMARVEERPAPGRGHGAAGLRPLPPGGGAGADRRSAGALLRRRPARIAHQAASSRAPAQAWRVQCGSRMFGGAPIRTTGALLDPGSREPTYEASSMAAARARSARSARAHRLGERSRQG